MKLVTGIPILKIYFLKAREDPFVKNLLIESMRRADKKKKHFEPIPIQEPEIMPHSDENPNPEEYEPRPIHPRKAVNVTNYLYFFFVETLTQY